jgi:uncharacterized membrane protein
MNLKKQIATWTKEGLINESQADSILEYESKSTNTPWAMYGIAGLGITVLMTGVISIVAANWMNVSDSSKLMSYFCFLIVISLLSIKFEKTTGLIKEIIFISYSFLLLAGIGLIGQIYNLNSESWRASLFWTILILPITLLAKTKLLPNIWFAGFYLTMTLWLTNLNYKDHHLSLVFCLGLVYLSLAVSYGFSNLIPLNFLRACRNWAVMIVLLGGGIYANTLWSEGLFSYKNYEIPTEYFYFTFTSVIICCFAIWYRRKEFPKATANFLACAVFSSSVLILTPFILKVGKSPILGCILFLIPWSFVAVASVLADRKRLFDFSVFIIGARFVVIYFEVFGSLTATGFGLILSGSVILFTVYCWHKYRSKIAALIMEQV